MSKITIYFKEIIKNSGPNPGQTGPIVVYIIRKHKTYLISAVYYTCAHCTNYSRLAVIHVLQADPIIQVPAL